MRSDNGSNIHVQWPLGKDWADAYVAWSSAFVLGALSANSGSLATLLIPSIMCTEEG